jgi:hypothetical protein
MCVALRWVLGTKRMVGRVWGVGKGVAFLGAIVRKEPFALRVHREGLDLWKRDMHSSDCAGSHRGITVVGMLRPCAYKGRGVEAIDVIT